MAEMWRFPVISGNVKVDGAYRQVAIGERNFDVPALIEFNGMLETVIKFQFNSAVDRALRLIVLDTDMNTPFIWIDECTATGMISDTDGLCVVAGKLGAEKLDVRQVDGVIEISKEGLRKAALARAREKNMEVNKFRARYGRAPRSGESAQ